MKKKLFAMVCLALASVFAFTSCGGTRTPGGGPGGGPITDNWWTTTGTLNKDEEGNVVYDNVEIKLSTVVNGEDRGAFNRIVAQFNAQYRGQINIVVTNIAEAVYESTVAQQIANGSNAPDILMSHMKGHKDFADNRLIQPFDEVMEQSGITFDMSDYADGLAQYASLGYDDVLFSVPVDAQSMVVYYNKAMLAEYGDGTFPDNRTDLIALLERIAEGENITPIAWSTSLGYFTQYLFITALMQNGGHLYDENDNYYADWRSDPANYESFTAAIASIRDYIYHSPRALASYNMSEADALSAFLSNNAFIYVSLPWFIDSIAESYGQLNGGLDEATVKEQYLGAASLAGWFTDDADSADAAKIFGDSHFFAMSSSVTDITKKAAICEFIRWFTTNGSVGASWGEAGHMTASKTISSSAEYTANEVVADYITNFYSGIDNFQCIGITPFYSAINSTLSTMLLNILGTADTSRDETFIRQAQDDFNAVVDFVNM